MGCNFCCWWRWRITLNKDSLYLSPMEACARVSSTQVSALSLLCHWYTLLHKFKRGLVSLKIVPSDSPSNSRVPAVPTSGCNPAPIKAFDGKLNLHAHAPKRRRGSASRSFPIPNTCLASLLDSQRDQSLPRSALPRGHQKDGRYPGGHSTHSHWE